MGLTERVAGALADRVVQVVGVLFGGLGVGHFAYWAQAPTTALDSAVATGDFAAAAPEIAAYAQGHPAYILAFLAGAVLLVRRP